MLITTHRHTAQDLAKWEDYEAIDSINRWSPSKEALSKRVMEGFLERNPKSCVMVSWGKDSVVLLHLFVRLGIQRPVVTMRVEHRYNPDCDEVRDAFLREFDIDYHEHEYPYEQVEKSEKHWADLHRRYGARCTGIRADESSIRRKQFETHGFSTKNSCRPLMQWSKREIFAYIHHNNLPLSPVYGYLGGGRWDRDKLRTHALHSFADQAGSGLGRIEWEREYYQDVLNRTDRLRPQ
jgi:phosphoadenosine phosphosulfate reductase